jgi:Bacterial TSP3 repeat
MRAWFRWLVLPAVICSCAAATAASDGHHSARKPTSTVAAVGRDTDLDGLSDSAEIRRYHTNPNKRDTDGDRLNDGAEVKRYHTNPRQADTDGDGLKDGDEVKRYHTNPRQADTDGDGFGDQVELGGGTNPRNARSHLGYPDETNTGVPTGTSLTPRSGTVTVSTNNTVLNAISTSDCVVVTGYGVTIKSSKVGCVIVDGAAADPANPRLTIQDTEIVCPIGSWNTGIRFNNFNAIRVNIHGCENGLDIGNHVTIRDSYIHDLATGPELHTDGIQSDDGSNSTIEHNTIYGANTSAVNINYDPDGTHTHDLLVKDNVLAGGGWTLYCPLPPTTNVQILDNQFSTVFSPKVGEYGPATGCAGEIQSGNVYHETGLPLNLG